MPKKDKDLSPKIKIVIAVAAILIAIIAVLVARNVRTDDIFMQDADNGTMIKTNGDEFKYNGEFHLEYFDGQQVFTEGDDVTLVLVASSDGYDIGGYDAVFTVDENVATLVSAESLLDEFKVYTNSENGLISITGVKDLNSDTEYILNNEYLANITFRPQTTGAIEIPFDFQIGETRDSNLVIPTTDDILAKAEGRTIYVGESQTFQLNTPVALDNDTELTVTNISTGAEACIDCADTVTMKIQQGFSSKELTFSIGGIAGVVVDSQEAFGYIIEVGDVTPTSLQVRYALTSTDETP